MANEPKTYKVQLKRAALKALQNLSRDTQGRVQRAIDELATNPRPEGCIRMQSTEVLYRIRVGGWRIIYTIFEDELIVLVVDIASRGSIYRDY